MSEFRFTIRTLAKTPGPTLVVVLTLAVAIGAATVVFSTIDMIWRFLPIADRERLVFVASGDARQVTQQAGGPAGALRRGVSIPDLIDWRERSSTFDRLAALTPGTATLTGTDVPISISTARVTTDLLDTWGITPALGRDLRSEEGRTGAERVAILTDSFWQRQFSGAPEVLGRSMLLNGEPHTVIGILPPQASIGFFRQTDAIVPLALDPGRSARDERTLFVTGRLKQGITREQAAGDLSRIAQQLQVEHPSTNAQIGAMVQPIIEASGMNVRFLLFLLSLIAALLMVMACANVANVVLAQGAGRRHELAVRAALGASRFDRIRRLMLEHFVAASAAGATGLVLAWWGIALLRWLAGDAFGFSEISLNPRVLAAGVVTSFLAPFGFGLLPALHSSTKDPGELREGGRAAGPNRRRGSIRRLVTALQVAIAMVLMIQIGLLIRTAWRLSTLDPGFDPRQLLAFRVDLPATKYTQDQAIDQFVRNLQTRIGGIPGVVSMGIIDRLPIADRESTTPLVIEGMPPARPEERPIVARAAISSDYLRTMRIPVLRGRPFTEADVADGLAVALVNEQAVRRYWPGRDPIGARVAFDSVSNADDWLTVVGIVSNTRNSDADQGPLPAVYVPISRRSTQAMAVVVRSESPDPLKLVPSIRAEVAEIDRDLPVVGVTSMEQVIFDDLAGTLVLVTILGTIGFVSLCLAATGIYGVVSYSVSQRTREIGVRVALGATPRAVVRMVMSQGAVPVVSGGAIGLVAALALAYVISASITEVQFRDPMNYMGVSLSILLVAFIASFLPARRAARINPAITLRAE